MSNQHDTVRLGVVGCGRVFERHHLPALSTVQDWDLIAICEPNRERREWIQTIYPRPLLLFDSLTEFLNRCGLDAVLITTPPPTHAQLTIQALEAGMHVLVEKPMALNLAEAHSMAQTSVRVQRQLWIGFNRRFLRSYLLLRKTLRAVSNHSVRTVRFTLSTNPSGWMSVTGYMGNDAAGGGVLDDLVSHQLDLLPWLLDLELSEIRATSVAGDSNGIQHIHCELRFANGFVAVCEAVHGGEYSESVEVDLEDRKYTAHWHGGLETLPARPGRLQSVTNSLAARRLGGRRWPKRQNAMAESFANQLTAFAAAVRGQPGPFQGAEARSGARTVEAIAACRESLQQGGAWIRLRSGGEVS